MDVFEYINTNMKIKNLHFLYRPKFIEDYAVTLTQKIQKNNDDFIPPEIKGLINELKNIVHPRYKMIECLKAGVVYLHGKIPPIIRNYILKYIRESPYLKHFVANSVILAGMNLPIDNLFYISGNGNKQDLINLIGRVNRLNEIFSSDNKDLGRIFIPVHFIEFGEFPQFSGGSLKKKIEKLRDTLKDNVRNPLLKKAQVKESNKSTADQIKEKENQIVSTYNKPDFISKLLRAGAQQLLNYNFDGLKTLEKRINLYRDNDKTDTVNLLDNIKPLFFDGFEDNDFQPQYNIKRLKNAAAVRYYKMFIFNLNTKTLHERIDELVNYWKKKTINSKEKLVYVGSQFGEVSKETDSYQEPGKVYVDVGKHIEENDYLFNLAIIKLQTDEDFLEYEITLLLNTMKEFELITQNQLDSFIYGTASDKEIKILRLGISRTMYRQLKRDQMLSHIGFDDYGNVKGDYLLKEYISNQQGLKKFELTQYF